MNAVRTATLVLVLTLLATPALAHVPAFPEDNTSPEQAVVVPDATKSWSFYDRLERGQVRYYRFSLAAGDQLTVAAFTPVESGFTPSIVLLSSAFPNATGVPEAVIVPEGMGALVVEGARPDSAGYEPFAPSANYETVSVQRPVDERTTYLLAVYEPDGRPGQVGVVVGYREAFSPTEYVTVPFDLVQTHLWEGQHPVLVIGPWLLTVGGGLLFVWNRKREQWDRPFLRYALVGSALLLLATAVNTTVQMGLALSKAGLTPAAVVTAVYIAVPALCGTWGLRTGLRHELVLSTRTRAGLALVGVAALVTWAGFIVGPAVILAVAILPARLLSR